MSIRLGLFAGLLLAAVSCTQPRPLDAGTVTVDAPMVEDDAMPDASDSAPFDAAPIDTATFDAPAAPDTATPGDVGVDGPPSIDASSDAALLGACTSAVDRAALPLLHAGLSLESHAFACLGMCFGRPAGPTRQECINDCIQGPMRVNGAISRACTACTALRADCGFSSCISMCFSPSSPGCVSCQCTNGCFEMADACSGIPSMMCP